MIDFNQATDDLHHCCALILGRSNPTAISCLQSLLARDDRHLTIAILSMCKVGGTTLAILWDQVFDRDTPALADALKGLSYYALSSIGARIDFRPDDLDGIKMELGRFKRSPTVRTCVPVEGAV